MSDLNSLHWTALKRLVEEKGGTYEDKAQAIAFLSSDTQPAAPVASNTNVTFDKSKPYGDVSGEIEDMPGARYFQNGHFFNGVGVMVG